MNAITLFENHTEAKKQLRTHGWVLLRKKCASTQQFDQLLAKFIQNVTFDPARRSASQKTQMVDSGTGPIGLHIENGNTPLPPDIVAFHCVRAATEGSETTVCDGRELWQQLPTHLQALFSKAITVRRTLDSSIWKRYVASALGRSDHEYVEAHDLHYFLNQVPGQTGVLHKDGSLDYTLTVEAVREDNLLGQKAFANALMGPSFNYETPTYCAADGTVIEQSTLDELTELSAPLVQEVRWEDGDVLLIDNKRVMHGRRTIIGPASQRIINIGMGMRI